MRQAPAEEIRVPRRQLMSLLTYNSIWVMIGLAITGSEALQNGTEAFRKIQPKTISDFKFVFDFKNQPCVRNCCNNGG